MLIPISSLLCCCLTEPFMFAGPGVIGHDTYDQHSVFANIVNMDHQQVEALRECVGGYNPCIPLYVCTIRDGQVKRKKGKMVNQYISPFGFFCLCTLHPYLTEHFMSLPYFNKNFTKTYLEKHISTVPKKIRVSCGRWSKQVDIKIGSAKQALLTKNWLYVSAHEALVEGSVAVFSFCAHPDGVLRLYVDKLMPCEDCA